MELTEPKLSLRERNKIRLRGELLEAVLDLFLAEDPAALNVEAVARMAGCSKPTVYVYFPAGLNEMLCALYLEISDEVIRDAIQRHDGATTTKDRIMALAGALLDVSGRPRRGKFFAQLNPALSPALQPVLGRSSGQFAEIIAQDLSDEIQGDTHPLAVLLVGALREASVRIATTPALRDELTIGFATLVENLLVGSHRGSETETNS